MPPGKVYVSHMCMYYYYYSIYIYNDYQIIIEVAQQDSRSSAWLGSISNASTT